MDLSLARRRALVLGSSSGLGKAIAKSLASEGATVGICSRTYERAKSASEEVGASLALSADLEVPGEGQRIVNEAAATFGGLDICIVNTGGGAPGGITDTESAADDAAYRSILRPALETARASAAHVSLGGQGRIIFLTARSILQSSPELALSSVMRSGVAAAARSLAIELAPDVLVNVIATGQFDTAALRHAEASHAKRQARDPSEIRSKHIMEIPLARLGKPQELGDVVAFLCSARASFITGTILRVDGGAIRGF